MTKKIEIELEGLKKQLKECQKLKNEYLTGWKKERANFLNYKKEEKERAEELRKYAIEELILKFLPILDNLNIAEEKVPREELEKNHWLGGFLRIKRQILEFLRNQGVEEITCLGEKFDPNYQEAVEMVEVKGKEPGIVVEEIKKGYKLRSKVIRPARVKISK